MPNDVIYLNGKHYLIDDNELRKSFNEFLGDKVTDSTFYIFQISQHLFQPNARSIF